MCSGEDEEEKKTQENEKKEEAEDVLSERRESHWNEVEESEREREKE